MSIEERIRMEAYITGRGDGIRYAQRKTREQRKRTRRTRIAALLLILSLVLLFSAVLMLPVKSDELTPPGPTVTLLTEAYISPEADENALIEAALLSRAAVIEDCVVTHYCICPACCGKSPGDPAYGITASGLRATPNVTVAVDPAVIPLGSDVLVDYGDGELCYYRADDTGPAVQGNHIDLCVSDHAIATSCGIKTATVYFVEEKQ